MASYSVKFEADHDKYCISLIYGTSVYFSSHLDRFKIKCKKIALKNNSSGFVSELLGACSKYLESYRLIYQKLEASDVGSILNVIQDSTDGVQNELKEELRTCEDNQEKIFENCL